MKLPRKQVVLESPFAGDQPRNIVYAQHALRDSITKHNETPYASHLLVTQALSEIHERDLGLEVCNAVKGPRVFYTDLCRLAEPSAPEFRDQLRAVRRAQLRWLALGAWYLTAVAGFARLTMHAVTFETRFAQFVWIAGLVLGMVAAMSDGIKALGRFTDGQQFASERRVFSAGMLRAFLKHGGPQRRMYPFDFDLVTWVALGIPPIRELGPENDPGAKERL